MKRPILPKINTVHVDGVWLGAGLLIGAVIPGLIRLIFGVFMPWLCAIGGAILLAFLIVFLVEMRQDNDRVPYYERELKTAIPFDPETQIPVVRVSICTGEKVAGFRAKDGTRFTEVMCIRTPDDLERFRTIYDLDEIRTEY